MKIASCYPGRNASFIQSRQTDLPLRIRRSTVRCVLGDSYLSYFRRKRMEKAARLLESTNRKVIDIAVSVGYENQGKFAKVFSDMYGVTPLEFRRLSK